MIVPTGSKRLPGVGTVLAHSLRRWIGVVPALGGCISCFVVMTMGAIAQWTRRIGLVLIWCRAGVVGGGPALHRHWACFSFFLGDQMTKI